jgi:hypothetical protein
VSHGRALRPNSVGQYRLNRLPGHAPQSEQDRHRDHNRCRKQGTIGRHRDGASGSLMDDAFSFSSDRSGCNNSSRPPGAAAQCRGPLAAPRRCLIDPAKVLSRAASAMANDRAYSQRRRGCTWKISGRRGKLPPAAAPIAAPRRAPREPLTMPPTTPPTDRAANDAAHSAAGRIAKRIITGVGATVRGGRRKGGRPGDDQRDCRDGRCSRVP